MCVYIYIYIYLHSLLNPPALPFGDPEGPGQAEEAEHAEHEHLSGDRRAFRKSFILIMSIVSSNSSMISSLMITSMVIILL